MDLFTIDNVGEAELLEKNTNDNSVKFITKRDVLNDIESLEQEEVNQIEIEEDENISDLDFGGKSLGFIIQFHYNLNKNKFPPQICQEIPLIFHILLNSLRHRKKLNSNKIWINSANC